MKKRFLETEILNELKKTHSTIDDGSVKDLIAAYQKKARMLLSRKRKAFLKMIKKCHGIKSWIISKIHEEIVDDKAQYEFNY